MNSPRPLLRSAGWTLAALAMVLAAIALLRPRALAIETAPVTRGPLAVTVDQLGEVRMRDRYQVTIPASGRLVRVALRAGDPVERGQTVATVLLAPLDPRQREEASAKLAAARSAVGEAQASLEKARAERLYADRERDRAERLAAQNFISGEAVEKARTGAEAQARMVAAGEAHLAVSRAQVRAAEAALLGSGGANERPIPLVAPVTGRVLRVLEQSERTLAAGSVVMVIGDLSRFEVVADVLSTDAVRIKPGARATLERWGGTAPLRATVRLVEPYAYTKVSALGVEEKRVDVVMDPEEPLGPLGDGYRVEARIVVWSSDDVLRVPASALFRSGAAWRVFVADGGRARERTLEVGERNARDAVVLGGLAAGDHVVLYPPNALRDGARIAVKAVGVEPR